jgi:hypothetical protein
MPASTEDKVQILEGLLLLGAHSTLAKPLNTLKKGRLWSASFTIILFMAPIRPVSF